MYMYVVQENVVIKYHHDNSAAHLDICQCSFHGSNEGLNERIIYFIIGELSLQRKQAKLYL